ncbi:MAG: enoyl-CoA hydratase/isomerase family protein [Pseudomonadota bacterium]
MASLSTRFEDGLATLTFTQPDRGNPLDKALIDELKAQVQWLWQCEGLRCVLLKAEGPNFSFGGDLRAFHAPEGGLPALVHEWTADLHMALQRLWALPVPLVAQVHGAVMGGSLSVVAGCDVVVAAQGSKFGSAFARIGLSCDSGTSATLTSRMGMARARRFVLLAEVLDSEAALAAGIVDVVVPSDRLADVAGEIARKLAAGPTRAYGEIKRLFLRAASVQVQSQLEEEALAIARVAATRDAAEGIDALLARRAAVFVGM